MAHRDFITVVSGLPRSGTSMMMQALEAGGLPVLTDHIRTSDDDNPKGYYEFEPVKKTKQDPSWVSDARGKVVKVIYSLVYDLPQQFEYRIVFLERDLDEVIASQKKMLLRRGSKGGGVDDKKLKELFQAELTRFRHWIRNQKCFSMLPIKYASMIAAPLKTAEKIDQFLGGGLDIYAMAAVVDPTLYRNKKSDT